MSTMSRTVSVICLLLALVCLTAGLCGYWWQFFVAGLFYLLHLGFSDTARHEAEMEDEQ